ncbi:DUF1016 N-terminal domain-containing protein [Pontiellaceae bacterium B12227]|nr:DUF1016 N-terminal domain-containing protein [Pontiellaceae bacterium B12227]
MQKDSRQLGPADLFGRVVSILETARTHVVRSVNSEMVTAYWLIGHEIVEEVQEGEERAEYGRSLIKVLSAKLNERFGKGFSVQNLELFRRFYLAFHDRESTELVAPNKNPTQCVGYSAGFMPSLGWSHYRALMRGEHPAARAYYEREAASNGWSVRQLERQIHSLFFEHDFPRRRKDVLKAQHILALGKAQGKIHARTLALKGQYNKAIVLPLQGKWVEYGREPWALPKAKLFSTFGTLFSHCSKGMLRKERLLIEECVSNYITR